MSFCERTQLEIGRNGHLPALPFGANPIDISKDEAMKLRGKARTRGRI
jgi:hypothetical protein